MTVEGVIKVMVENTKNACALIREVLPRIAERPAIDIQGGDRALDDALVTNPSFRDPFLLEKLSAVAGRVFKNCLTL